jgi:hypothetical protein
LFAPLIELTQIAKPFFAKNCKVGGFFLIAAPSYNKVRRVEARQFSNTTIAMALPSDDSYP